MSIDIRLGDCRDLMPTLPDQSIDCVLCDPPYPHIKRAYGMLTEEEWWSLMMDVCREARRVLKPSGSAVFVLQPNSRKVGSMRGWLWRFMAWACDEWNMVQDAWWWNTKAIPGGGEGNRRGLLRPSVKACVWLGPPDCHRDRLAVLKPAAERYLATNKRYDGVTRSGDVDSPSKIMVDRARMATACARDDGVTPFNLIAVAGAGCVSGSLPSGQIRHPASTPVALCNFWVRYISPIDGVVLDPFLGSGTVGLAAYRRHRSFVGFESMPEYVEIARRRLAAETEKYALFGAFDEVATA